MKFEQWRKQFNLFQDDKGIWRCRGRIQNAAVSYSTKHPILLHQDYPFTFLVAHKAHEDVLHNGVKETLTKIWIVRGRSLAKKIVQQCHVCRRYEGKPYSAPQPPPLPHFRVEEVSLLLSWGVILLDLSTSRVRTDRRRSGFTSLHAVW